MQTNKRSSPHGLSEGKSDSHEAMGGHVFNMQNFIHYLRWTIILRNAVGGEKVCDFGCGDAGLLELLYRNRTGVGSYVGLDSHPTIIEANRRTWVNLPWAAFETVNPASGGDTPFLSVGADTVVAFNVPEGLDHPSLLYFLQNMYMCGNTEATYYIRLHKATGLFSEQDVESFITEYFTVVGRHGIDGELEDFKPVMTEWYAQMSEGLLQVHSPELVSAFMSPFFPDQCPSLLWVLKRKTRS